MGKSFRVCGISVAIDGSEDSEIQIKDLAQLEVMILLKRPHILMNLLKQILTS